MTASLSENLVRSPKNVVVCAESSFAIGAWITIWSGFHNSERDLCFHLLTTAADSVPIRRIEKLARAHEIPFNVVVVDQRSIGHLPATERLPIYAYLRLLAPEALPHLDKFLYLDSDLLVRTSLSPLFSTLSNDTIVSGVRDYFYSDIREGLKQTYEELGLSPVGAYLNTGVMMINARLWRQRNITAQALEYLQKYRATVAHGDQDALNAVFAGSLSEIDFLWNVQLGAIDFFDRMGWPEERGMLRQRREKLLSEAKIAHFLGPAKPWKDGLLVPYAREYRIKVISSGWVSSLWAGPWLARFFYSAITKALKRRL
jgi:lipopolysaccharide biosynthesis glycosyltransferase